MWAHLPVFHTVTHKIPCLGTIQSMAGCCLYQIMCIITKCPANYCDNACPLIHRTWNFREFRTEAIRVQEIFANFRKVDVLVRVQVQYYILVILVCRKFSRISWFFAKFARISCTRKFAVLQYMIDKEIKKINSSLWDLSMLWLL